MAEKCDFLHPVGDFFHLGFLHATRSDGWGAEADAVGIEGATGITRKGVGIQSEADEIEGFFVEFATDIVARHDIDENEVIVGASTLEDEAVVDELGGEGFGVFDDLFGVGFKAWF